MPSVLLFIKSLHFAPWITGLFVCGGMDSQTGVSTYINEFELSFLKDQCKTTWEKEGVVPLPYTCLNELQVSRNFRNSTTEEKTQKRFFHSS